MPVRLMSRQLTTLMLLMVFTFYLTKGVGLGLLAHKFFQQTLLTQQFLVLAAVRKHSFFVRLVITPTTW